MYKGLCIWSPDAAIDKFSGSDRSCNTVNHECIWNADEKFHSGHNDASFCKVVNRYAKDVLTEYGFHDRFGNEYHALKHKLDIDVVSLKIEGSEPNFIRCWDFQMYPVKVWIISTIDVYIKEVDELMMNNGYLKFEVLSFDRAQPSMIFVRRNASYPWTEKTKHNFYRNYKCTMVEPEGQNLDIPLVRP